MVVMLPCFGPDRPQRAEGGVGTVLVRDGPQTCSPWPACFPSMARVTSTPHRVRRAWRCPSRLLPLMDLPHEHRDAEALPSSLPRQERALALRQMPALAVM